MSPCPWYISAAAVRKYLAIVGRRVVDDGPEFDRAERELMDEAIATLASERVPKQMRAQHLLQYRGGPPRRMRFIVSTARRKEGPLPALVDVLPAFDRQKKGR